MLKPTRGDILFYLSLILAIWFALTGMVWTYGAAIFVAYPAGIVSLVLWGKGRSTDRKRKRYQLISIILGIGLLISLLVLFYLLIFD